MSIKDTHKFDSVLFCEHFSILFSMSLFHFISLRSFFFARIMKSKRCKIVWTQLAVQTNKLKHIFLLLLLRTQRKVTEEICIRAQNKIKKNFPFHSTRRPESSKDCYLLYIFFGLLCTTFCVYKLWRKTTRHYKNECCGLR